MPYPTAIAYFITPHGFGHASRAAAVMAAVQERTGHVRFELFTTCPKQIFNQSLITSFGYHAVDVDIGVVQTSPLTEDLPATCRALDCWLPFNSEAIEQTAQHLKRMRCALVVCDISPFGIEAAAEAGIPSLLVENFTWDWIYSRYAADAPCLLPHSGMMQTIFARVDYRIQTQPLCQTVDSDLTIGPISRKVRTGRRQTRKALNIPDDAAMVLISMGGVRDRFQFLDRIPHRSNQFFVIPGADGLVAPQQNVILLPTHSPFFHPDLSLAADLVIGKVGYSTLSEIHQAGTPFGYISRPDSPESEPLVDFIHNHMTALPISAQAYNSGRWIDQLPQLLSLPRSRPPKRNGADQAAEFILDIIR
jgi:UDP-N-acetylglucosamine:LPS N-acetylglucosamine transferase